MSKNRDGKIGFGIIGTGLSAQVQANALLGIDWARIACFGSHSRERASRLARRYPGAEVETSVDALVRRDDVDLVSIATPPAQHCAAALAAIGAGKAVLCEKPFALNATEAKQMLDLASERGVRTFANFEFRRFGPRAQFQRLVAEGYTGRIRTAFMVGSSNYYQLKGEEQGTWWLSSKHGGGWLGASASHDLDTLRFILGEITEVCADLPQYVRAHPVRETGQRVHSDVDDAALLLFRCECGASGLLGTTAAAVTPTLGSRIEVYGDEGTLILMAPTRSGGPLYAGTELLGRRTGDAEFSKFTIDVPDASSEDPHTGPAFMWLNDVVDSMRTGAAVTPDFRDGFENQLLLDSARRSYASRAWVAVSEVRDRLTAPADTD